MLPESSDICYTSQLHGTTLTTQNFGNGFNWLAGAAPYVGKCTDAYGNALTVVVFSSCKMYQFTGSGPSFTGVAGVVAPVSLSFDYSACAYLFVDCRGNQYQFNCQGQFLQVTLLSGNVVQQTSDAEGNVSEVQQSTFDSNTGNTTITSIVYTRNASGPNTGLVSGIQLRRQVNGGPWSSIRQTLYTYYGEGSPPGTVGDLQFVVTQVLQGTCWITTGTSYYRYYTAVSATGFVHGLKYVLGNEAFRRLQADPQVGDPTLAPDSLVAQYADNYYEYDSSQRVTKAVTNGGLYTYLYSYQASGLTPSSGDYNTWISSTTITRPDGNTEITYVNSVNDAILHVLTSGSSNWCEYHLFNANAQEIQMAEPSAVSGYSGGTPGVALTVNLFTGTGLIHVTGYGASTTATTTTPGDVLGYVKNTSVQRGSSGLPVLLGSTEYLASPAIGGVTVYPVADQTIYTNADGTGAITTSSACVYYSGSNQVQFQTTTLPVVPSGQNGDGNTYYRRAMLDIFGNQIATQDERGYITTYEFDVALGVVVRMVQDDDPPAGSGWTANPGTRLKLATDFEYDDQARRTQTLGPAFNASGQTVRTANWTVYQDAMNEVWTASGYAVGSDSGPEYAYTLVNPVSINRTDEAGRAVDSIQAVRLPPLPLPIAPEDRGEGLLGPNSSPLAPNLFCGSPGRLSASDRFPQSTWVRWSHTDYSNQAQMSASRVYFCIPCSGCGCAAVNYNQTGYGYDAMGRQNRQVPPGGTITRSVFDARSQAVATWVGTNDAFATDADPSGGGVGAGGNNMVIVTGNVFDGGSAGGDGNLTSQTQYVDATGTNDRTTTFDYDFRDRRTQTNNPIDNYSINIYDNLNRVIEVDRHALSTGTLIGKSQTIFDNLGRAYQTLVFAVDPSTGTVGNSLVSNTWFDPAGNTAKSQPAGSQAYAKSGYDPIGRTVASYLGYSPGDNDDPWSVGGNDKIFEQTFTTFDDASHAVQAASYQRWDSSLTSGNGPLNGPDESAPNARVSFNANWYDGIGRQIAAANYGTNGNTSSLAAPDAPPASSADVLVSQTFYNERGEAHFSIDPAGKATRTIADDVGRQIRRIENYVFTGPCPTCGAAAAPCRCLPLPLGEGRGEGFGEGVCPPPGNDQNVTLDTSYNADGQTLTLTARNPVTGDQTTRNQYGTTLADSAIARNDLLVATIYPDAADPADCVILTYNRQSQQTTKTDQNGSQHGYTYDLLGRPLSDAVTTLAAGVDDTVLRIDTGYEVRGMVNLVTSYADTAGASVVNQVLRTFNTFGQLACEYQEHNGAVNTATSLGVQYSYLNGSTNTIRRTGVTYPNGRAVNFIFNTGDDDALSRISYFSDSTATLVAYVYLGLGSIVQASYPQPNVVYSLAGGSGTNPYAGLDGFGRVVNAEWLQGTTALVQIGYGYDLASNRIYRQDFVAEAAGAAFDESYGYDGMQRLVKLNRGTFSTSPSTGEGRGEGALPPITGPTLQQGWHLDATGNWTNFTNFDQTTSANTLDQQRASNTANEITAINRTVGPQWATPAYDRNGNMTTIPEPLALASGATAIWDAWNRLIGYDTSLYSYSSLYDGLNRRVIHVESDTPRNYYYSDQWQILEERIPPYTTPDRQFVWGLRYIDDCVLRDRSVSGTLDERLYALQDANWNLVALCNTSAAIVERYAYTAYGVVQFLNASFVPLSGNVSAYSWETLYCGYRYEAAIGLYLARHRWLNPPLGCWLSRDPLENDERRSERYAYAAANPAALLDAMGTECVRPSGIEYVGGRGTFNLGNVQNTFGSDELGSVATFLFTPASSWPTMNGCPTCCCCSQLGFIQVIFDEDARYEGVVNLLPNPRQNQIDGDVPYPYPSKKPRTINPCMVAPGIGLEFGDSPSAANTLVRTYTSFKQDFELCAVCIYGGLEGPLVDMGSVGATTGLILTRMAVYGCVKWGHKVTTSKTTRYIEHDIVTGPSPQSVNVGGKYPGSAPSAEWKKVVTEQFPALYPAIVKHYGAG